MTRNGTQPCSGCIARDTDGNVIRRYACEVHLFDPGTCAWQQKTKNQRNNDQRDYDATE